MYLVEHDGADLLNEALELRVRLGIGVEPEQLRCLHIACRHRQAYVFKKTNGEPLASLAYALISKYTLNKLLKDTAYMLKPHEFKEGYILYLTDSIIAKGRLDEVMEDFNYRFRRYRLFAYVRDRRIRLYKREAGRLKYISY